jgi:2-polyprenyl-3-methyl-5-hydroxy-6-metoxy-1,4-benzoquinol methylase
MTRRISEDDVSRASEAVTRAFESAQVLKAPERAIGKAELDAFSMNWQDDQIPMLQRRVVEVQLAHLRDGIVDPVFASLARTLKHIDLERFSLLDVACASGYYSEVVSSLDDREITYAGCDYSRAMVEAARSLYPQTTFSVQDVTDLRERDGSHDVVLVAGVLEHVPGFERAIAEVCRVARHNVIVHRCPLTSSRAHLHTLGSQYNIETPRTWFAKHALLAEFAAHGFELAAEVPTYEQISEGPPLRERLRRLPATLKGFGRVAPERRSVVSLVFRRHATKVQ